MIAIVFKKMDHEAVFCLIRGMILSGIQKTGRVRKGVVSVGLFCYGPELHFDSIQLMNVYECNGTNIFMR